IGLYLVNAGNPSPTRTGKTAARCPQRQQARPTHRRSALARGRTSMRLKPMTAHRSPSARIPAPANAPCPSAELVKAATSVAERERGDFGAYQGPLAASKAPGKRLGTPDPAGAVKRASEAFRGERLLSFHCLLAWASDAPVAG